MSSPRSAATPASETPEKAAEAPRPASGPEAVPEADADAAGELTEEAPAGEWGAVEPTSKEMGLVRLTLDKGVKTTVVGQVYGLDFEIENEGYQTRIFFDYYSRRLKVLDYDAEDFGAMTRRLEWLADANDFDKVFLKARKDDWQQFLAYGYVLEGILKYYFRGEDAYVMSKFRSMQRIESPHLMEEVTLIEKLMEHPRDYTPPPLPEGYTMTLGTEEHIPGLVALYRRVFETYPSPLTHPDYIQQTMHRHVVYRVILDDTGEVVAAASAEVDDKHKNAEMTDCATLESQRGRGLMFHILRRLEDDLRQRGIMTGYTLARAQSGGMNRVFHRLGYEFTGRLVNNCDIYGEYEDMNIWVKPLGK